MGMLVNDVRDVRLCCVICDNERSGFRKAREAHIIYKAKTLEPLGIKKRDQL